MLKKRVYHFILAIMIVLFATTTAQAQVLNVTECFQEYDQWCWAGTSQCVLFYYGFNYEQCEIAEYTRLNATFHDFGDTDCCVDPTLGCNYWNYNYGYDGSIQMILIDMGGIDNYGISKALTISEVQTEISGGRPFVIRWKLPGGGHFIVGHGLVNTDLYYMDPWFGEGLKVADYSWVLKHSGYSWTHTNVITTNP